MVKKDFTKELFSENGLSSQLLNEDPFLLYRFLLRVPVEGHTKERPSTP